MDDIDKLRIHDPHNWMRRMADDEFEYLLTEQGRGVAEREPGSARWMLEAARRLRAQRDKGVGKGAAWLFGL
jgi:hypothetical protein